MPTLESLTVPQLAALCGLKHDGYDAWTEPFGDTYTRRIVVPKAFSTFWNVWPHGTRGERIEAPSEHAALVALAKHLNLTPKEDAVTTPTTKYKRIEKDPESNDYDGYVPKAGDVWCFHDGQKWPVTRTGTCGLSVGPNAAVATATIAPTFLPVRSLTTHIERPVTVRDVKGPGYEPKPGDVLCGPDGAVFKIVTMPGHGDAIWLSANFTGAPWGFTQLSFAPIVALATRIEREE